MHSHSVKKLLITFIYTHVKLFSRLQLHAIEKTVNIYVL